MGRAKALLVRLSSQEHAQINELAEQEDCSRAELVRRAVAAFIRRHEDSEGGAVRGGASLEMRLSVLEQARERDQRGIRQIREEVERLGRSVVTCAAARQSTASSSDLIPVAVEPREQLHARAGRRSTEGGARAEASKAAMPAAHYARGAPADPAERAPRKKAALSRKRAASRPAAKKTKKKAAAKKAAKKAANRGNKKKATKRTSKKKVNKKAAAKKAAAKKAAAKRGQRKRR